MRSLGFSAIGGICLSLLLSCQKINLDTTSGESKADTPFTSTSLKGSGQGTLEYPYTIPQFISTSLNSADKVWVVGYAVGTAYRSMTAATFSAQTEHDSNLLLSADSLCQDTAQCIPAQFTSSSIKLSFSLLSHPEGFHQCILLEGTPGTYLYKKGLRSVDAGHWLYGFNLSAILPEEWQEQEIH